MNKASDAPDTSPPDALLQPGLRLSARYELVRALGAGAVGALWLARDVRSGAEVAVKVLHARHLADRDLRARFETEARTAAALVHPCIIEVLGAGQLNDGRPYLVTEYVSGTTLEHVAQGMPLHPRQAIPIAISIAEGLARAHDVGIVHRDLKPSNVLVSMSRSGAPLVKISDFGLARPAGASASGASLVGTPRYMAPELFSNSEYTPQTDLYSLGCILFELLTATPCLAVDRFDLVPAALATRGPLDLAARAPECGPALAALVASLLAPDPAGRPRDAHVVARALRSLEERASPADAPAMTADAAAHAGPEARAAFAKTTQLPRAEPPMILPPAARRGAEPYRPPPRAAGTEALRVAWEALESDLASLCERLARETAGAPYRASCERALRAVRDAGPARDSVTDQRAALDDELRALDAERRRDRERTGLDAAALGVELSQTRARGTQLAAAEAAERASVSAAREALTEAYRALPPAPPSEPVESLVDALVRAADCARRWRGLAVEHGALLGARDAADAHATALEARLGAVRRYHQRHEEHLATLRARLEAEHAAVESEARGLDDRLRGTLRRTIEELRREGPYTAAAAALEARLAAVGTT